MSFLLLDDGFAEHPKVASVTPSALKVHISGLCYCAKNLTDGHINERAVKVVQAIAGVGAFARRVAELVTAGLWTTDPKGDGYWIHDYLEHNLSASQIKAKKEAARKAARARWDDAERNAERIENDDAERNATGNAERNAERNALPSHALDLGSSSSSPPSTTPRENGHDQLEQTHPYFALLHTACGATDDALTKLRRAARGKPEAAIVLALESCTGPGVRDPLAVALAELAKAGK